MLEGRVSHVHLGVWGETLGGRRLGGRARSRGDLSERAFARYEGIVRKRYHHFRRFVIGFYDPAFRELWFTRNRRLGIYSAIVSVLAGNWRPSILTRAKIALFFGLVALKRRDPKFKDVPAT